MKPFQRFAVIYLYRDAVDMRKQIRGLSVLVEQEMKLNVFSDALFLFTNRRRNMVKALYWNKTGFALWMMRLEKNRFYWPRKDSKTNIVLGSREIDFLLKGYDLSKMRPHQELKYKRVS
jgi:transposase